MCTVYVNVLLHAGQSVFVNNVKGSNTVTVTQRVNGNINAL